MKIFFQLVVALVIVCQVLAFRSEWKTFRRGTRQPYAAAKGDDAYEALRLRLQDKLNQNKVQVTVNVDGKQGKPSIDTGKKVEKVVKQEKVVQKQVQAEKKEVKQTKETQVTQVVAPSKVVTEKVNNVQVVPPSNSQISGAEVAGGIGLGLLPYLLVPVLLYNALQGLLKKPKPLPATATPSKAQTSSKSIAEGAKEGIKELQSGKQSDELNDIRNGYKIATASFGVAAAVAVGSLLFGGGGGSAEKANVVSKTENKAVQVQSKKVEAPKKVVNHVKKDEVKKSETTKATITTPSAPTVQAQTKKVETVAKKEEPAPVKPEIKVEAPPAVKVEVKEEKPVAPALSPAPPAAVLQPVEVAKPKEQKPVEVVKPAVTESAPVVEKKVTPVESKQVESKPEAKPAPVQEVEAPKAQVVTVDTSNADSKKKPGVIQQAQPDVVDLSRFQSLRNKKN